MHQAFLRLTRLPERRRLITHFVPLRTVNLPAGELFRAQPEGEGEKILRLRSG